VHLRLPINCTQEEDLMRKITMTLAAAVFVFGTMGLANAQTQGASSLNTQAQNATIIHKAACNDFWGPWCPPGRHRVCGPYRFAGALPAGEPSARCRTTRPPAGGPFFMRRNPLVSATRLRSLRELRRG
jgi:hypothetical protein